MKVHAILPRRVLQQKLLAEVELLSKYMNSCIHLAPSGVDDDAFILRLARETSSLVLSNDLFRDHGIHPRLHCFPSPSHVNDAARPLARSIGRAGEPRMARRSPRAVYVHRWALTSHPSEG